MENTLFIGLTKKENSTLSFVLKQKKEKRKAVFQSLWHFHYPT
jgi:hypothetical protein